MLIVGDNLRQLVVQNNMCDPRLYDVTSLRMTLMSTILAPVPQTEPVVYEHSDYSSLFERKVLPAAGLSLAPGQAVLACTHDSFVMPLGYFGQVQTKGSLARLFVTAHMNDSQVDPGYRGRITLELVNMGPFDVTIPVNATIASMYVWKCSTNNHDPYSGRYNLAEEPTSPRLPQRIHYEP